ncbi:hypothetical protein ACM6Q7_15020 [Peribacillus butanolivorans]|uniref:hypothetical protein n=1 Tax=Peribacillus butanolivorans TaxID=421767 RepID=UPI0039FDB6EA
MYKNVDKIYGMNVEAGFMDQATRERMVSNTMNTSTLMLLRKLEKALLTLMQGLFRCNLC